MARGRFQGLIHQFNARQIYKMGEAQMIYSNQALIIIRRFSLLYVPLPVGGPGQPES